MRASAWGVFPATDMKTEFRAAIFDLGGTLIDQSSWAGQAGYIRDMASVLGVPYDEFLRLWRATYADRTTGALGSVEDGIRYICRALGASVPDEAVDAAAGIPCDITRRWLTMPKEGALRALRSLRAQGLKIGVLSNWSSHLPLLWKESPLSWMVDAAVISSAVGLMKPDPAIFRLAASRLGVDPGDCLYVADGMDGELAGATAVGMTAVMIRSSAEADDNPYRERWTGATIESLDDVVKLVRGEAGK